MYDPYRRYRRGQVCLILLSFIATLSLLLFKVITLSHYFCYYQTSIFRYIMFKLVYGHDLEVQAQTVMGKFNTYVIY